MASGGNRDGAGRKPGTAVSPAQKLSQIFRQDRNALVTALEKSGVNPFEKLVEMSTDPNLEERTRAACLGLIVQHTVARPMAPKLEERATMNLPEINGPADVAEALKVTAHYAASGTVPTRQIDVVTRALTALNDAYHLNETEKTIEALEQELSDYRKGNNMPNHQGGRPTYRVVSGVDVNGKG